METAPAVDLTESDLRCLCQEHTTEVINHNASSVESRKQATLGHTNNQKIGDTDDFLMLGQLQQIRVHHLWRATWHANRPTRFGWFDCPVQGPVNLP
jgi:hypothetical protein